MNANMDGERFTPQNEACSLDIVQLESSDDEFEFDKSRNNNQMNHLDKLAITKKEQNGTSLQGPFHKDDDDDIDSEEEKDILKGIRDEIESKVREEMKDEIQVYQSRLLAIEAGKVPGDSSEGNTETNDTEQSEMDPKLKEAIVKMQKLDRILRKKMKREREVKRERLILEKRLKDEISEMHHGATNYREIKMNTERFLALEPPPSHNEGVTLDYEEEEDMPPLFQTQIDDCEIKRKINTKNSAKNDAELETGYDSENKMPREEAKRSESSTSGEGSGSRNKNNKKDFIKRNKELAGAANEVIAMTDDEKKRLQDLLGDIDDLEELDESFTDGKESSVFQLVLNPGDGFVPDDMEMKSLTNIDEKLKYIMPEDDYMSIAGHSQYSSPRTDRSDCHLTDDQLDDLLNQCARSMSRTSAMDTPDSSARSEVSSRLMLLENPPKLTNNQLQQLLTEAYYPMSSQLASLEEDPGEGNEISAETWKTIMDERLDENDDGRSGEDHKNISQNARSHNKHCNGGSYNFDNLLTSGKDELSEQNSVNHFQSESLAPRFRSKSKEFEKFPKISSSSSRKMRGQTSSPSVSDAFNQGNSSSFKLEDDCQALTDQLRLPSISSNSFLIHTSQGLNNESSSQEISSAKEPISMVHNNLSDMSLTSFTEESWDQNYSNSHRTPSTHVPKPPSTSQ